MNEELLDGAVRLAIPLLCIGIAAVLYNRVGLVNLALDGQVTVAAIAYVAGTNTYNWVVGMSCAFIATAMIGALIILLKERFRFGELLLGLGFYYVCVGAAQILSELVGGQPASARLIGDGFGARYGMMVGVALAVSAIVAVYRIRAIRVAKVVGVAPDLVQLQGVARHVVAQWHNLWASGLLALAGLILVDLGGAFTWQISSGRGFIALAFLTIGRGNVWVIVAGSLLFGGVDKIASAARLPSELLTVLPYLLAIIFVTIYGVSVRFRQSDPASFLK